MSTSLYLIESKTLSSNVASVTFTAIPNTYTDLYLVFSARIVSSVYLSAGVKVDFNNGAGGGYQVLVGYHDGATASGFYDTTGNIGANTIADQATSGIFSDSSVYIPQYKNTSINKCWTGMGGGTNASNSQYSTIGVGSWNSTQAISSMTFTNNVSENWIAGSTFYLYGIINS